MKKKKESQPQRYSFDDNCENISPYDSPARHVIWMTSEVTASGGHR